MDSTAIKHTEVSTLRQLGLKAGDAIRLKEFCSQEPNPIDKMKRVLDMIKNKRKSSDTMSNSANNKAVKKSTRKVQLGWMNYQSVKKKYVSVRLTSGGGTRNIVIENTATVDTLKDIAITEFFPDGLSKLGYADNFEFNIGNFKGEEISNPSHCSIKSYHDKCKMSKCRLYLLSKQKDNEETDVEKDDDSDCDVFLHSPFSLDTEWKGDETLFDGPTQIIDVDTITASSDQQSFLMGTTQERQDLQQTQNQEYEESLR